MRGDFVRTVERGEDIGVRIDKSGNYYYADCWVIPVNGGMPIHTHRFQTRISDLDADQIRALQKRIEDQMHH